MPDMSRAVPSSPERLHRNAEHMRRTLTALGAHGQVRQLADSARTAVDAAQALGVEVGAIASSLVFVHDGAPLLVVTSGAHRVEPALVEELLGGRLERADADAVRAATGQPIGGVGPVGHPAPLRTLVDVALGAFEVVWAAAGTPHAVFPTSYAELLRITGGTPAVVGR
ncbi:YbaK/EbsC family protein [Cellulomonas cellasea]|uniref:YbaK/EbsC family protein n=1 Tax=Cellulomonas cellasea TaxID=43670 RepID=UPI003F505631